MTETGPVAPKPRAPLWWRVLVGLSLTLNLLVIGLVVGVVLSRKPADDRRPFLPAAGVAPMVRLMPPDHRDAVWSDLRKLGAAEGITRAEREAERIAVQRLIAAEPFDAAALVAALDARQTQEDGFARAGHRVLAERLEEMPQEARAEYAERLERFARFRDRDFDKKKDRDRFGHGGPPPPPDR